MTSTEALKKLLLMGKKVNKIDFFLTTDPHTLALTQRIYDLRKDGWNVKSKTVKGKGSLKEYYLDASEIERLEAKYGV